MKFSFIHYSLFHIFLLFEVMADGSHFGWSICRKFKSFFKMGLLFSVSAAICSLTMLHEKFDIHGYSGFRE